MEIVVSRSSMKSFQTHRTTMATISTTAAAATILLKSENITKLGYISPSTDRNYLTWVILHRVSKNAPPLVCYNDDIYDTWMDFDAFRQKYYQ